MPVKVSRNAAQAAEEAYRIAELRREARGDEAGANWPSEDGLQQQHSIEDADDRVRAMLRRMNAKRG